MDGFEVLKASECQPHPSILPRSLAISSEDSDVAIRRSYELVQVIMSIAPLMRASCTAA